MDPRFFENLVTPNHHHHHHRHVAFSYLRVIGGCFHFLLCAQNISFCVCLHVLSAVPVHWVLSVVGLLVSHFLYPKVISVTYFCSFTHVQIIVTYRVTVILFSSFSLSPPSLHNIYCWLMLQSAGKTAQHFRSFM